MKPSARRTLVGRGLCRFPGCSTWVAILLTACASSSAVDARAATMSGSAHDDSVTAIIHHGAQHGTLAGLRWPRFPYYRDQLLALYAGSGGRPIWSERGRPSAAARSAIAALQGAEERGLHPEDYDASLLVQRSRDLSAMRSPPARDVAWFDLALSVGLFRNLSDVHRGRVNPKNISVGINVDAKKLDMSLVVRWVAEHGRAGEVARDLEPRFVQYRHLKVAHARYRSLASRPDLRPVSAPESVRPGAHFDGAAALKRRLVASGDLPASQVRMGLGTDSTWYDRVTAGAVKRFQERHGLDADSVLGPATVAAINVPFARRVRQLELAMERIRWLPALDTGPFVVVNVPSFQLYAFDTLNASGVPTTTMNVVVGRDQVGRRTPLFERDMKYIIFRPYWVVPRGILRNEILPALRRNPGYLKRNDMEIYSGSGDTGPALPATAVNIDHVVKGELGIRERPGPKNSLGLAKFIFPNDDHVFMHGTPATELFSRSRRDFSHGCIRLEDPARLGVWVLRDPAKWPMKEVKRAMEGPSPRRVNLARPLPVVLYYSTAVVLPDGAVAFYDDIYRHDLQLEKVLAEGYPYAP